MSIKSGVIRMTDHASGIVTWVASLSAMAFGAADAVTENTSKPITENPGILAVGLALIAIVTQLGGVIIGLLKKYGEEKREADKKRLADEMEKKKEDALFEAKRRREEIRLRKEEEKAQAESLTKQIADLRIDLKHANDLAANLERTREIMERQDKIKDKLIEDSDRKFAELEAKFKEALEELKKYDADKRHEATKHIDEQMSKLHTKAFKTEDKLKEVREVVNQNATKIESAVKETNVDVQLSRIPEDTSVDLKTITED